MDPGYNAANRKIIEENARMLGIPATIFETQIFDAVYNIDKSPCYLVRPHAPRLSVPQGNGSGLQ